MTLHRFARPFLLLAALVLYGQDASLVLRSSVGYRTLRNCAALSDEQKEQADALSREAEQANGAGKYGDAMRAMQHGMAVMRGVQWTPAYEFAAGLTGKLDHAVVDPGRQVTVSLAPLYQSAGAKLGATVYLVSRGNRNGAGEKQLATGAVEPGAPFSAKVALPAET